MTTRQKRRAKKCLNQRRCTWSISCTLLIIRELTGVTFLVSPSRTHSCSKVKLPTQAIVNKPTHFTLKVAPRPTPVAASQNHHDGWNAFAGPCSCWFVKLVQARAVMAVKRTSGESSRMSRDWVTSALSTRSQCSFAATQCFYTPKITKAAPKEAVVVLQPAALRVRNMVGMLRMPQIAGSSRMAT